MSHQAAIVKQSLDLVQRDNHALLDKMSWKETGSLTQASEALAGVRRLFFYGAGRSGLALRMTAMRMMHLGYDSYVVGDATTPSIGPGDALVVASGSGTTASVLQVAEKAEKAGAVVVSLTTDPASPLAALSTVAITVPGSTKQERPDGYQQQYAGSLFEQAAVLIGDSLFHALWRQSGKSAEDIWPRHSNLE